jgi:hypothetical protein
MLQGKQLLVFGDMEEILDAVTSDKPVVVSKCKYIPDAYEAILSAEKRQLVRKDSKVKNPISV